MASRMFLVLLVVRMMVSTEGMISEEYPIKPSYDSSIPSDVQDYYTAMGIVISTNTAKTVGKYFRNGDYDQYDEQIKGDLCDNTLSNTPAYYTAGTGSIIGKKIFLTAYHVVEALIEGKDPVENPAEVQKKVKIVFDFKQTKSGSLAKTETYHVEKIFSYSRDQDWIILQTTKAFKNRNRYILADDAKVGDIVYVLGYPLGQPLRYAEGKITEVDDNVDIGLSFHSSGFTGSSGAPVVRLADHKILGLFAYYGDTSKNDFQQPPGKSCFVTTVLNPPNYLPIKGPLAKVINDAKGSHEEL